MSHLENTYHQTKDHGVDNINTNNNTNNNMENTINKVTKTSSKDFSLWLYQTLDLEAQELFGEFGYATCTMEEQMTVLKEVYEKGLIE